VQTASADVADAASVRAAFEQAARALGPVAILVNNAGQAVSQRFDRTDEALWQRMLAVNLDRDDNWELLVNRPISTASQFFERYRFFPQGEIHALYWDGVGLGLQWKTRRVKGSVADFALADVNNDGVQDLVLCVNTHPGALGMESRKTMVLAYPLDLSKVDPNTAAANEQLDQ